MTRARRASPLSLPQAVAPLSFLSLGGGRNQLRRPAAEADCETCKLASLPARLHSRQVETVADGIGPVFNDVSCVACHSCTRGWRRRRTWSKLDLAACVNGQFDPMTEFGGSLIQRQGIGFYNGVNFVGEVVPPGRPSWPAAGRRRSSGWDWSARFPTRLRAARQSRAAIHPRTAGRVNLVTDQATGEQIVGTIRLEMPAGLAVFVFWATPT